MPADLTKTIDIVFKGKDEVGQITKSINNQIDGFGDSISSISQPLNDMANNVLALEAAFAALVIGGLSLALNKAGEFNDAFAEITTLIDDTGTSVTDFKNDILDYSTSSTQSIEKINQSIYNAISAGIDYKDARALGNYLTERGKIIPRRISGNCAKHQREITTAIKRARNIAILPFTTVMK